jgi:hypothetical protein
LKVFKGSEYSLIQLADFLGIILGFVFLIGFSFWGY